MPTQELRGGCMCGAIRYRASGYDRTVNCHCTMCRKATGGAFATWICIPLDQFELASGEPVFRRSSPGCSRGFCRACGSPLFMRYDADQEMTVSLGSLDDSTNIHPEYSIWVSEQLPWTQPLDADLSRYPGDPA